MTNSAEQFAGPLRIEMDPFTSGVAGLHSGRRLQIALHEIIPQIILHTRTVLVTGSASTGKTLLVDMVARTCPDMGLSVLRVDRGDLMQITLGEQPDVLLIDEAHTIADSILEAFSREDGRSIAGTTVFLACHPVPLVLFLQISIPSLFNWRHFLRLMREGIFWSGHPVPGCLIFSRTTHWS